ncbi:MAG: protease complex subunit PrcB family protein [Nanoarchaeota archaeon]
MKALAIFILLALLVIGCKPVPEWQPVTFQDVATSSYAPSADEQFDIMVNSEADWEGLWINIFKASRVEVPLENVNFANETVFAAFYGQKMTGGYQVKITGIEESKSQVRVKITATSPPPGSMVTQSITTPYHIVKTKKITKPASFLWS